MKKIISMNIIILLLTGIFFISYAQNDNDLKTKINDFLIRINSNGFSGSILVAKDGKIILSKGYGLADRERNIPITNQTVFTVGSITKQFTGAAILKLQMMGRLNVNDPITKYFKNVPDDKKEITLHHLLTHTAGFPGAIGDDFQPISREEFTKLAMETRLQRKPGELYEYSNVGYSLLGAIIEIITHDSYEKFLHQHLFEPAGMKMTGYRIPQWKVDELAHGYRGEKDWGTLLDKPWANDGPYWHLRANGGILSTVEDMYQWHLALQGDKILSEEVKQAYYTPYVPEGEGADSYYGYGWAIFATPRNTRLIAHNGGNGIFAADFLRYLDEDVVIIGLSNIAGKPAWKVTTQVARIVFGYQYRDPFEEQPMTDETETSFPSDDESAQLAQKWRLPNSNTGRRSAALLEAINRQDENYTKNFIQSNFTPGFLNAFPIATHLQQFKKMYEDIGEFELKGAVKTGAYSARLKLQSIQKGNLFVFEFELEAQQPFGITGLNVEIE